MAKLVDALALGASGATHGGSSPLPGTKLRGPTVEQQERSIKKLPSAFTLFKPSMKALVLNVEAFVFQLGTVIGLALLATLLLAIAAGSDSSVMLVVSILFILLTIAAGIVLNATLALTILRSAQGKKISFDEAIRQGLPFVWRMLGLTLLTGLIIVAGLILLIVPGVFAFQRLLLAPYFLIDKNIGVIESIKRSARAANRQPTAGAVWGLVGVIILIGLSQVLPFVGGAIYMIISILFLCAPAVRYLEVVSVLSSKGLAFGGKK